MSRGGPGRRPLPTAVKKLRGNPGKRPANKNEPVPTNGIPEMPDGLTAVAQKEWKAIAPQLEQLGVLAKIDGKALAAYCECFATWRVAADEVTSRGITLEEPVVVGVGEAAEVVGYKYKRNPAVTIANDALKLMKSFLIEFGLTPASRSRLRIEKPQPADPMDEYLRGGALPSTAGKAHVN